MVTRSFTLQSTEPRDAGPMVRIRMPDEMLLTLRSARLPAEDELSDPVMQRRALRGLQTDTPGLMALLGKAVANCNRYGGVIIENCAVEPDEMVAVLSAAWGDVDPAGNGIPSRLVFDVTPRRFSDGLSTAGSSRGSGEFWLHTDSASFPTPHQYVTLGCVSTDPRHGGESLLVEAGALARRLTDLGRGEHLAALADPVFPFFSGERSEDDVVRGPILRTDDGGHWHVRYRGKVISEGGVHQSLDALHAEALATFEEVAAEPDLLNEFALKPGDLWILDNRRWLHGRRAFAAEANRLLKRCKIYSR